jgi:hypothetical protein
MHVKTFPLNTRILNTQSTFAQPNMQMSGGQQYELFHGLRAERGPTVPLDTAHSYQGVNTVTTLLGFAMPVRTC